MLNSVILPSLGKLRLKAIGRQDIEKLHSSRKATPYQANRVLELLSAMFNYAIKERMGADNPARGIEAFPEAKRECWFNRGRFTAISGGLGLLRTRMRPMLCGC